MGIPNDLAAPHVATTPATCVPELLGTFWPAGNITCMLLLESAFRSPGNWGSCGFPAVLRGRCMCPLLGSELSDAEQAQQPGRGHTGQGRAPSSSSSHSPSACPPLGHVPTHARLCFSCPGGSYRPGRPSPSCLPASPPPAHVHYLPCQRQMLPSRPAGLGMQGETLWDSST